MLFDSGAYVHLDLEDASVGSVSFQKRGEDYQKILLIVNKVIPHFYQMPKVGMLCGHGQPLFWSKAAQGPIWALMIVMTTSTAWQRAERDPDRLSDTGTTIRIERFC